MIYQWKINISDVKTREPQHLGFWWLYSYSKLLCYEIL